MRIAYITPEFVTEPYFSGGLANYLNRISIALAQKGHEIHIFVQSDSDDSFSYSKNIIVHRTGPTELGDLIPFSFANAKSLESAIKFSFSASKKIECLHKQEPFDVVQAANSKACGLFTFLRTDIPAITRISCYRPLWNSACFLKPTPDTTGIELAEFLQLKLCNNIFAPSRKLIDILKREAKIKIIKHIPTPIFTEINQFDTSLYEQTLKGREYLLFVGRYQKLKGFDVLVHALKLILNRCPKLYVALIGKNCPDEQGRSMYRWAMSELNEFSDRIYYLPPEKHEKLYPFIQNSKLVVLPSRIDNMPNVCLESMMLGKPVVGSNGASFEEIITHKQNGFLATPGDPENLAQTILDALSRKDLNSIGEIASKSIRQLYCVDSVMLHEEYYKTVINSNID